MANMFTPDIKSIKQSLQNSYVDLLHLRENISAQFGDAAKCIQVCDKTFDHIDNALRSLTQLDRVIPADYTNESYDRSASKLECRIKRLERFMKQK